MNKHIERYMAAVLAAFIIPSILIILLLIR